MKRYGYLVSILIFTSLLNAQAAPDTLWTKTVAGMGVSWFTSLEKTTDGGFIAGGFTAPTFDDSSFFWLVRLDSGGDTLWTRAIPRVEGGNQRAIQTADGGVGS